MPPLVVPGVCRFTMHQTFAGHQIATIVDMHIDTDLLENRGASILDQAKVLNANFYQCFGPQAATGWILTLCSWVDLDTLDGTTGETALATEGVTLPANGSIAGDTAASSVSYLVKKVVTEGRRVRNGRWYISGVPETGTTGNAPSAGAITYFGTALPALLTAINQSGAPIPGGGTSTYDSELVVVHTPAQATPSFSKAQSLTLDPVLATQRERLRP